MPEEEEDRRITGGVSAEDGRSLSSSDLESVYANVRVTDVSGVFICKDRTHIITNMPTDKKGLSHHLNHPLTIATNLEKLNIFHIRLPLILLVYYHKNINYCSQIYTVYALITIPILLYLDLIIRGIYADILHNLELYNALQNKGMGVSSFIGLIMEHP